MTFVIAQSRLADGQRQRLTRDDAGPRNEGSHRKHSLPAISDGVGLKCRFHDLRHTFASLMLMAGANAKVVSEALGHSSVGFTLDTYSHVLPTMQKTAMSNLDKLLGPAMPENKSVSNFWGFTREKLEPARGFEPPTRGLRNRRSTPELRWLASVNGEKLALNWRYSFGIHPPAAHHPVGPWLPVACLPLYVSRYPW
jgi:hypothetical protein